MRAVALVVAAVMVCGCSSSGSADLDLGTAAPTTTPVATTAPPTIDAPTTTNPPVVTDPPTTPAPTITTAPPTTVPPAEITAPLSKEDQVRADYEAARLARAHCTVDPATCDYGAIAIAGSPMDVQTHEVVAQRLAQNLRSKPGFGDTQIIVESVGFEGTSAFVTICVYDTVVLFDIQDPSNPEDDIVVNDSKDSSRVRWELRSDGQRWLMYEGTNLQHLTGGNLCA